MLHKNVLIAFNRSKLVGALMLFFLCEIMILTVHRAQSQSTHKSIEKDSITPLFEDDKILSLKFTYQKEDLIENSNDSIYIPSEMAYLESDSSWRTLPVKVRVRGGYRRTNCYYTPIKLKFDDFDSQGSIFQGNKKLKLVFPCLKTKRANDNLINEYMAYKIYEVLSVYHFKTRLFEAEFVEIHKGNSKKMNIHGFMIQDDQSFALEHNGKEIERFINHKAQNTKSRVTDALFQYMIGNTDYSIELLHNTKLFYIDNGIIPVPYDFDMSGLVDASYAVVSNIQNEDLPIENVRNRLYRGFQASENIMQEVRSEFLEKEDMVFDVIDKLEIYFQYPKDFESSKNYIAEFYETLYDDKKFKRRILNRARTQ